MEAGGGAILGSPHISLLLGHWAVMELVSYVLNPHCKENPSYVFLSWELRGLSPNFHIHIHVSVSDLYIPRIGPHTSQQQNRQT
jgi:hypothetical protein